jgi:hypothetical protein
MILEPKQGAEGEELQSVIEEKNKHVHYFVAE